MKTELGIKHADAIALLDHPGAGEASLLAEYLSAFTDVTTYKDAVAYLEQERSDPANQVMYDTCGWTYGMVCPECTSGCGCNNDLCSGWRHQELMIGDEAPEYQQTCEECGGAVGQPYGCEGVAA